MAKITEEKNEGWPEWSKHVLNELVRINSELEKQKDKTEDQNTKMIEKIHKEITEIREMIASVKGQVLAYGLMGAGLIAIIVNFIFMYVKGGK